MCTLTILYCMLAASAMQFILENTSAFQFISPLQYDCGPAYQEIKTYAETGFISSPNNPNDYPAQVRCIWMLKAPPGCHVQLRVDYIRGQSTRTGTCIDYLDVQSRSSTTWQTKLISCHLAYPAIIVSDECLLRLKFVSDQSNSSEGFNAEWSITCDGNRTTENVSVCSSDEYSCPNLECIRNGYHCDGRNDCGCTSTGCDEVGCPLIYPHLTEADVLGICVAAGLLTAFLVYFGSKVLTMIRLKFQPCNRTGQHGRTTIITV